MMLATIEGNLKPSGACNIYPKVIKVHTMAGANVIMYGLFFWIKYTVAESKTATAVINWAHAKYLQTKVKSTNVNAYDARNNGTANYNLETNFSWLIWSSSDKVILELLSAVSPVVIGHTTTPITVKATPIGPSKANAISWTATDGVEP